MTPYRWWLRVADAAAARWNGMGWRGLATAVAIAAGALIMMGEIARLVEESLTPAGGTGSLGAVLGPKALSSGESWTTWSELAGGRSSDVALWIGSHAVVDVAFFVGAGLVLLRLLRPSRLASRFVVSLVAVEAVESGLLLVAASWLATTAVPAPLIVVLALATTLKWGVVLALVLTVLRAPTLRPQLRTQVRRTAGALKYQRFSVVPVLFLAVLSTLPGANILDQLPDAERGWLDDRVGVQQGIGAFVSVLIVACVLYALGRRRHGRAERTRGQGLPPSEPEHRWVWLLGPALAGCVALWLAAAGPDLSVDVSLLGIFLAVPLVLLVLSAWVDSPTLWTEQDDPLPLDPALVRRVGQVGDGLALALVVVFGLGMIRSFTAPVVFSAAAGDVGVQAVGLVVGGLIAVGACWAAGPSVRWVCAQHSFAPQGAVRRLVLLTLTGMAFLLALVLFPLEVSDALGVVATVVLALGAWVAFLGSLVVYLQDRPSLPVFRLLRLRANPLLSLLVAVPVLVTLLPADPTLHELRTLPGATPVSTRPSLADVFGRWRSDPQGCVLTQDVPGQQGPVSYRPLLLVAASGGGIRAAYWTSGAMDALSAVTCGRRVTLLSSGVSGGAVGLAVSRQVAVGQTPTTPARSSVSRMAAPDALSAGLAGTLVGDLLSGVTGLRIPPVRDVDRTGRWRDRAGLMEVAWEQGEPGLAQPWDAAVEGPGGALILNSTAVGYGCRVLVSQVALDGLTGDPVPGDPSCRARSGLPAGALDLTDLYGDCLPGMSWSTAAMLAARFPTVTPAGRLPLHGRCGPDERRKAGGEPLPDLQLVDGGYAESSGLGTLADLAPELMDLVQDHNAQVLAGLRQELVIPVVAYLEDEILSDVTEVAPAQAPEAFVPLAGRTATKVQASSGTLLQRVAGQLIRACPEPVPAGESEDVCEAVLAAVHQTVPDSVVLVAVATEPAVQAPLGWTLSCDSQRRLDRAMARQVTDGLASPRRYAGLGAFLRLLNAGQDVTPVASREC